MLPGSRIDHRIDEVFAVLDDQVIGTGQRCWVVRVIGIHHDGHDRWIQIAREDDPGGFVLHLPAGATPHDAIATLQTLPSLPAAWPRIVHVPLTH